MRLKDKVAFITGAAGGMGAAIARRFAAEGAKLVLTDISARRMAEIGEELAQTTDLVWAASDVLNSENIGALVDNAITTFGRIDILVNVVGGIGSKNAMTPLLQMDDEQIDRTLALNLKSIFVTARHILPLMQKQRYGRVVNITSASMSGQNGQSDYAAAKAGVAGLTRTMAIEFAPDITVNCIAPSLIRTRVMERFDQATIDRWAAEPLLKRIGEPEDIANAVLFLGSDEASYITGVMLPVTGGSWPAL